MDREYRRNPIHGQGVSGLSEWSGCPWKRPWLLGGQESQCVARIDWKPCAALGGSFWVAPLRNLTDVLRTEILRAVPAI